MIKKIIKISTLFLLVFISMSLVMGTNSYAKTKKKINKVTLKIVGNVENDTDIGNEDIEVTTNDSKYEVRSFEFDNVGFKWSLEDTPELSIELQAEDGYYFNIDKSSNINLSSNATYKSARRLENATVLKLVVTLPPLDKQIGEIEYANISDNGKLTWSTVQGSNTFEIKLKRNISLLGGIQTVVGNELDVSKYMTREGTYYYSIRAINNKDSSISSDWITSDSIYIDKDQAKYFQDIQDKKDSLGQFLSTSDGQRYYIDYTGNYIYSDWKKINNEWYYFGANGYMVKGWYQLGEEWYYFDMNDGHMLKNQLTPDGYQLTIVGTWAKDIPQVSVK